MYSVIKGRPVKSMLIEQLPSLAAAFLIAEVFYKFKSFSLECLAFLATWLVLDWAWTSMLALLRRSERA
jgi:hypothetical protein